MQNRIAFHRFIKRSLLGILYVVNFSIAAVAGGRDTYWIYLNDKLVLTERDFEQVSSTLKALQLSRTNYDDQIVIYFSHCGYPEKDRQIVLEDKNGKVFHKWQFANSISGQAMKIPVKEIWDKGYNDKISSLTLHYYSEQLSRNGRMLTPVTLGDNKMSASASKPAVTLPMGMAGVIILAAIGGVLWLKQKPTHKRK